MAKVANCRGACAFAYLVNSSPTSTFFCRTFCALTIRTTQELKQCTIICPFKVYVYTMPSNQVTSSATTLEDKEQKLLCLIAQFFENVGVEATVGVPGGPKKLLTYQRVSSLAYAAQLFRIAPQTLTANLPVQPAHNARSEFRILKVKPQMPIIWFSMVPSDGHCLTANGFCKWDGAVPEQYMEPLLIALCICAALSQRAEQSGPCRLASSLLRPGPQCRPPFGQGRNLKDFSHSCIALWCSVFRHIPYTRCGGTKEYPILEWCRNSILQQVDTLILYFEQVKSASPPASQASCTTS